MVMNPNQSIGEQEMLNDMLNQEKQIVSLYSTAITESSCQNMRQVLNQNLTQTCEDQYSVFDNMRIKGYYQAKVAPPTDVQQAKQKFTQMQTQI